MSPVRPLLALLLATLFATLAHAQEAPQRVTMTLSEFLSLYDKANAEPEEDPPPRPASLASTELVGTLVVDDDGEPEAVSFTGTLRVVVHAKQGLHQVPVLSNAAALTSATLGGRPASVVLDAGWYTLLVGPGTHDLSLAFAVGIGTGNGLGGLTLPLAPSGATKVSLRVPGEDLDVTFPTARQVRSATTRGERTYDASVPSDVPLRVTWTRALPADEDRDETRIDATVYSLVQVGEGLVRSRAIVQHTVRFQGVDSLRFAVPEGYSVLDVAASGLSTWKVDDDVLTVGLTWTALGSVRVNVDMEHDLAQAGAALPAPLLRPLGAERTKGFVGVTADGTLEVTAGSTRAATATDVRTLPPELLTLTQQPMLLGFKYVGDEVGIPLRVVRHDEVAVVVALADQAVATTMFTEDGRRITSVTWHVRNNSRQFLRVTLPEGADPWSAAVSGRAVQPARSLDGTVLVPIVRSSTDGNDVSTFAVELVYVESMPTPSSNGSGVFGADLPRVDVPSTYVAWTVYAPDRAKVDLASATGSLRHVPGLSRPLGNPRSVTVTGPVSGGGESADGTPPVRVSLPLEGRALYFEKLLAMDERLYVQFGYRGLR